ncbi:hypothetical protein SADUNF_Sadunf05G0001900 [Salix dunnii]|uniref:Uncharacterized protein n=1 Tax=Salix dunnii TaxID=1413687 RepID=A0A835MWG2_9ROSI|nr:hypothetical protein SADUNF_Sadunf05G0001900 [Salix dunnii]
MSDEGTATCIDILLAIILPPLGVFLKFGCGSFGSAWFSPFLGTSLELSMLSTPSPSDDPHPGLCCEHFHPQAEREPFDSMRSSFFIGELKSRAKQEREGAFASCPMKLLKVPVGLLQITDKDKSLLSNQLRLPHHNNAPQNCFSSTRRRRLAPFVQPDN